MNSAKKNSPKYDRSIFFFFFSFALREQNENIFFDPIKAAFSY